MNKRTHDKTHSMPTGFRVMRNVDQQVRLTAIYGGDTIGQQDVLRRGRDEPIICNGVSHCMDIDLTRHTLYTSLVVSPCFTYILSVALKRDETV